MNFTIRTENFPPKRIVSLVPSQTELLYYLEVEDEVKGITKFCVHPEHWLKTKTVIGGTKNLNLQKIFELNPDLIIGNKEENALEQITELQQNFQVYMSDIYTLTDALKMIADIGVLLQKENKANDLVTEIKNSFDKILKLNSTALYLIWGNPYMAAGRNTFIGNMMEHAGFENILSDKTLRYPELSWQEMAALNPEYILLSSEPFPFKTKHEEEIKKMLPKAKIIHVDGEMFSWYGSRLRFFGAYIEELAKKN